MAGIRKMDMGKAGGMMIGMLIMVMAVAVVGAQPANKFVYPFWSVTDKPARLGEGYLYFSALSIFSGALAPEYDESNATYYVRLSDSGATYAAAGLSTTGILLVNTTVTIVNTESQTVLTWRQEGTDEYFLIEEEATSVFSGAPFRFLLADEVPLPCPRIAGAQCHAYHLVSDPSGTSSFVGLQAYEEDSAIYIKAAAEGSTGNLPIVLRRTDSTTSTIRSVTAREE